MPGPGAKRDAGKAIEREIWVYEPTALGQAVSGSGFYTEIRTRLVAKAKSEPDGMYKIKLPPGRYSVFTKEPGGLFANLFDGDGIINPVIVKDRGYTRLDIVINYAASY